MRRVIKKNRWYRSFWGAIDMRFSIRNEKRKRLISADSERLPIKEQKMAYFSNS